MKRYSKRLAEEKEIAVRRIKVLFKEARQVFKKRPELAHRYVHIARKIAMKLRIRFPPELKKRFCKHCYKYLVPGVNCRVRVSKGKVIYYCYNCKEYMRFPYAKEKTK